jgi:hypothetical protein
MRPRFDEGAKTTNQRRDNHQALIPIAGLLTFAQLRFQILERAAG